MTPQPPTCATLVAVLVGTPVDYGYPSATDPFDKPWTSAIIKEAVSGPVQVHTTHVEGDQVADLRHHGGEDQAVLAYSADHLPYWREVLGRDDVEPGGFGENFSIRGQDEDSVCIGDRYQVGGVEVEVSHPRQPCRILECRWRHRGLLKAVRDNGKSGWYLRIRKTGPVAAGQAIRLVERPHPEWTVAQAFATWFGGEPEDELRLASVPALGQQWREILAKRAHGHGSA